MYVLLRRYGMLPKRLIKNLRYSIEDVFLENIPLVTLRDFYGNNNTIGELISRTGFDRKTINSLDIQLFKDDNSLDITIKEDKTVCLDENHIDSMIDKNIQKVSLYVLGTLVINSAEGYRNLNFIDRQKLNNKIVINTRVTPYIINWILTHLMFKEVDLSGARLTQNVEIHIDD